jgi:hypothetical protein
VLELSKAVGDVLVAEIEKVFKQATMAGILCHDIEDLHGDVFVLEVSLEVLRVVDFGKYCFGNVREKVGRHHPHEVVVHVPTHLFQLFSFFLKIAKYAVRDARHVAVEKNGTGLEPRRRPLKRRP